MSEKIGFLRNHGDAIAIIASTIGVNIALGAILITLTLSNSSGVAACNARIDATLARIDRMYEILMNRSPAIPSQSFRPYNDVMPQPNDWMIKDPSVGG